MGGAGGAGPAAGGTDRCARRGGQRRRGKEKRRGKPPAGEALRETRADGWVRAAPGHPWLDPAVTGDPAHRPARPGVGVDGKERKLAKADGNKKVHLLGAITHVTGLVIGQDKVAKAGKANEITHFRPLLEPLPLAGVVITADAMQTQREHARWLTEGKDAFYLLPVLGNQPVTYAALDALDWENTPVAAATSEISRGRIETRTIRVLPAPEDLDFPARPPGRPPRALRHDQEERPLDHAQLRGRALVTSLDAVQASPADLLAYARGHWLSHPARPREPGGSPAFSVRGRVEPSPSGGRIQIRMHTLTSGMSKANS